MSGEIPVYLKASLVRQASVDLLQMSAFGRVVPLALLFVLDLAVNSPSKGRNESVEAVVCSCGDRLFRQLVGALVAQVAAMTGDPAQPDL